MTTEDMYNTEKYNELVKERKRLLQNMSEDNPMIQNLNPQLNALREKLSQSTKNTKKSIYPNATIESLNNTEKYNELVKERKRLLQNMSQDNPMIQNIDLQLNALREHLSKNEKSASKHASLQNRNAQENESVPFAVVEDVPVFPGCEDDDDKRACFQKSIQKHISKNFNYPKAAQDKGVQGRVSVMFTIAEDGSIKNAKYRGPDPLLEEEAARIIGRLPQMKPGKQDGEVVEVPFSIPITFKLESNQEKQSDAIKDKSAKSHSSHFQFSGYYYDKSKEIVSGTILDGSGRPLPGVNITIAGSTVGTISDFDGVFTIAAKKGDFIKFQYNNLPDTTIIVRAATHAKEKN